MNHPSHLPKHSKPFYPEVHRMNLHCSGHFLWITGTNKNCPCTALCIKTGTVLFFTPKTVGLRSLSLGPEVSVSITVQVPNKTARSLSFYVKRAQLSGRDPEKHLATCLILSTGESHELQAPCRVKPKTNFALG